MKNKIKRVLVITSTFPRWTEDANPQFVFDLSQRLTKNFDITILTPNFPGSKSHEIMGKLKVQRFRYFIPKFEKLAGDGGILPTLRNNKLNYLLIPFFLFFEIVTTIKLTKKIKPDIIHAHWIIPQGLAAYLNFLVNHTPYIVTSHGSDLHSLGFKFLKNIILQNAKKITVVSSYLKKEIKNINPQLLSKTEIIPMGVDTKMFNSNRRDESIKKKYNITGPFLLFVGRLIPEKGVSYLLKAMPRVLKKYPKSKLMIIGDGTLESKLKRLTAKLKIETNVIFTGPIHHNNLPPFYATADIFISPSIKEGFGLTFLEASSSNCQMLTLNPHLKTNLPSIKLTSSKKMSTDIIEMIRNPQKQANNQKYSWESISKKYTEII